MQTRTKRQHEVLEYITDFINERGYEPSYQQIARAIGIRSKGAIAKHIVALENQGFISRTRESGSFGIELLPENSIGDSVFRIEWLEFKGQSENARDSESLIVPKSMVGSISPKNLRAFRVPNDAMLNDHICERDIALVENRDFARDRDCVVALVDKTRAVIKKFYRRGADIELRPANDNYKAIILPADRVEILGIFRGLIRPIA